MPFYSHKSDRTCKIFPRLHKVQLDCRVWDSGTNSLRIWDNIRSWIKANGLCSREDTMEAVTARFNAEFERSIEGPYSASYIRMIFKFKSKEDLTAFMLQFG